MSAADTFKIAAAQAIGALGTSISLHSANPGTTGASEITGGGYARLTTTWGTPVIGTGGDAGKAVMTGSTLLFNIPVGISVTYFGVWSGTTFRWGEILTPGVTLSGGNGQANIIPVYKYTHA